MFSQLEDDLEDEKDERKLDNEKLQIRLRHALEEIEDLQGDLQDYNMGNIFFSLFLICLFLQKKIFVKLTI